MLQKWFYAVFAKNNCPVKLTVLKCRRKRVVSVWNHTWVCSNLLHLDSFLTAWSRDGPRRKLDKLTPFGLFPEGVLFTLNLW